MLVPIYADGHCFPTLVRDGQGSVLQESFPSHRASGGHLIVHFAWKEKYVWINSNLWAVTHALVGLSGKGQD